MDEQAHIYPVHEFKKEHFDKKLAELKQLVHSPEFQEGNLAVEIVLDKVQEARFFLELAQQTALQIAAQDVKTLEKYFHHLAIDAFFQSLDSNNTLSVHGLISLLKLSTEKKSLGHKTFYRLVNHLADISDSFFVLGLGNITVNAGIEKIHSAYQLACQLEEAVECEQLKKMLDKAKAELFLALILQNIISQALEQNWSEEAESNLQIAGVTYRVPAWAKSQFNAIEKFLARNNAEFSIEEIAALATQKQKGLPRFFQREVSPPIHDNTPKDNKTYRK